MDMYCNCTQTDTATVIEDDAEWWNGSFARDEVKDEPETEQDWRFV